MDRRTFTRFVSLLQGNVFPLYQDLPEARVLHSDLEALHAHLMELQTHRPRPFHIKLQPLILHRGNRLLFRRLLYQSLPLSGLLEIDDRLGHMRALIESLRESFPSEAFYNDEKIKEYRLQFKRFKEEGLSKAPWSYEALPWPPQDNLSLILSTDGKGERRHQQREFLRFWHEDKVQQHLLPWVLPEEKERVWKRVREMNGRGLV